ncbi:MAG: sugar phosphate isomerase/epimerase [Clostridia bacterium]|nr:sugar phosphate isomerase/epimerase [Clostridia bacterium]
MKKFKVGLQLYSVRWQMEEDMEATLKAVAEMGYDCVEFAGYYDKSPEYIESLLEKYGLKCYSVHQNIASYFNEPEKYLSYLKAVGAKYSVIPWNKKEILQTTKGFEDFKNDVIKGGTFMNDNGFQLLYHNHDFEFFNLDGGLIFDRLYSEVSEEYINPQIDTCWVKYAGYDPCEYLEKYSGRVPVVHLKDFTCKQFANGPVYALIDENGNEIKNDKEANGFEFKPLGEGIQDIPAIIEAAEKAGSEILIVEQDNFTENDPMKNAKISREYLKSIGY